MQTRKSASMSTYLSSVCCPRCFLKESHARSFRLLSTIERARVTTVLKASPCSRENTMNTDVPEVFQVVTFKQLI